MPTLRHNGIAHNPDTAAQTTGYNTPAEGQGAIPSSCTRAQTVWLFACLRFSQSHHKVSKIHNGINRVKVT
jgi:hypothetical protein